MSGRQPDSTLHDPWSDGGSPGELVISRGIWRPADGYGRILGYAIIIGLMLIAVLSLLLTVQDEGPVRVVWGLLLAGAAGSAIWVWSILRGLSTIRYVLGDSHLSIEWKRTVRRIAYDDMLAVTYHLRERLDLPQREPYWPGYRVSTIRTREGIWHSWATVPPHRRVRITTPVAVYAISPERPVLFIQELERRRMGSTQGLPLGVAATAGTVQPSRRRASRSIPGAAAKQSLELFRSTLLTDRIASTLVAVGVIIPVFLLAYTFNEVEFLPERIPLHWNAAGEVVRTGGSAAIWTLPLLALSVLVVNAALATLVIRFDRVAARMFVAITPVVQVAIGIALWRIIN